MGTVNKKMYQKISQFLEKIYKISGYIAAIFMILIASFIITGILSRIFGFYVRGLAEYSGYSMAAASFLALAYTFNENEHIRITLFLEKANEKWKKILQTWCLLVATIFSGYFAFYFFKMLKVSYEFQERSEGADEILIWIPQSFVALGSFIFFICITHQFLKIFIKKNYE